ncbi:hypothetical protein LEP1GSC199_1552 [Leptospira vanthielii serovar Holland str. Waz Holland = ATCC 700522]|uniref:Uncharacterized protein n=1 Tax=Leptospira vanthielii serovar Holland str. Waz Holland = ATCC 700522 TaxID=1218591 RepID=N1WDQ7_9LEPT|nr:hypothetical protein LEP1GSC199_1552 [Leptospira vanthielii serovar Holland str. Waz Holland = ATCC 700522]
MRKEYNMIFETALFFYTLTKLEDRIYRKSVLQSEEMFK